MAFYASIQYSRKRRTEEPYSTEFREIVLSVFQLIYGFVAREMTKIVAHMLKNTFTLFVYKFMLIM